MTHPRFPFPRTADAASVDPRDVNRRVVLASVGVAVLLVALKAFALGASGSVSILASLADSALDLAAALMTLFAVRWAAASPGEARSDGKAEALAVLVQAGLVFASAVFIGWEAIQRMVDPRPVTAGGWAVGVMLVAIAVTVGLVWLQTRALKAGAAPALAADRAQHAADLGPSVVVLIGVASGAWLGAAGLDAAAGLVVAVWLVWGAAGALRGAAEQLLDKGVDDETRARVTARLLADPRIRGAHGLRVRRAGAILTIQAHADLDPALTLDQAHAILAEAEARIHEVAPGAEVILRPDPRGRVRSDAAAVPLTPAPQD